MIRKGIPIISDLKIYGFLIIWLLPQNALLTQAQTVIYQAASPHPIVEYCRSAFPDTVSDPSSVGGIKIKTKAKLLGFQREVWGCFYGDLSDTNPNSFTQILGGYSFDYIAVRSLGGEVDTWLTLAEALEGKVDRLIVDDICYSSCANYVFPVAKEKTVYPNGLVVWHGGPTLAAVEQFELWPEGMSDDNLEGFTAVAERTEALYQRLGVSSQLLTDTSGLTLTAADHSLLAGMKPADTDRPLTVTGYAIDPVALEQCYGMKGLREFWHPNFTKSVHELGLRRSSNLSLLMRPGILEERRC